MSADLGASARALDQFYTRPAVAAACLDNVLRHLSPEERLGRLWLEPSAGAGAFYDILPEPKLGLDLEPKHPAVQQADFLTYTPDPAHGKIIAVGNPPFGKNASLAIKFFNHAATFCDAIAFIVPRTFEKSSTHRRLSPAFWLVFEETLPVDSFEFQGLPYAVPCVFQIWKRQPILRDLTRPDVAHPDFVFTSREEADFAFQRVGARAGHITSSFEDRAAPSHYFIKDLTHTQTVTSLLNTVNWGPIKERTAGNPSIAKSELVAAYIQAKALARPTGS